jgi:signal transduction histidine kinase
MTEEGRAHIFDPLYTTKKRGRGTGLGLVVVRQVVSEHGGTIEVESEPGRGARFRLTFPATEAEAVAAGVSLPRARVSAERTINRDGQEQG